MLRSLSVTFLISTSMVAAATEHHSLLPEPREIHYGKRQLAVRGLSIRFAAEPATEDRFAAETLARLLSERSESFIPVIESGEFNPLRPEVTTLLQNWIGQLADLFPSPFFHVGMDETWELEMFAKEKSGGIAPGKIYLDHFKNVAAIVHQYGKHVMVWADRFQKYPDTIKDLPAGTILVPWNYGPTADYKPFVVPFGKEHLPMIVATGVTVWNQIAPDFDLSFNNIDSFLATGRTYNLLGHMNTIWTDDAQTLTRPSFPGIAYGAAAGWQSTPCDRARFFADYAGLLYSDQVALEVARALEALTAAETHRAYADNFIELVAHLKGPTNHFRVLSEACSVQCHTCLTMCGNEYE
jgi:hypothetical protein